MTEASTLGRATGLEKWYCASGDESDLPRVFEFAAIPTRAVGRLDDLR